MLLTVGFLCLDYQRTAVFLVSQCNIRSAEALFMVGFDTAAETDKNSCQECMIVILVVIMKTDGIIILLTGRLNRISENKFLIQIVFLRKEKLIRKCHINRWSTR